MKLVIKFPSRNRPEKFLKALDKYYRFLSDKNTEIICSFDNDDETMKQEHILNAINQYQNVKIFWGDNKSKIEAVNANLQTIEFDILLLASDDMLPTINGFDEIIKDKMLKHYPDTDGVLWFNDGYQGNKLNTLSILGKKYYDRFGYIYYPEYRSVWCDNEFMDVANILEKQTYFDETIIRHEHPDWGFGNRDEVHNLNNVNGNYDKNIYNQRKNRNFNL
jgi:hypothetical protein